MPEIGTAYVKVSGDFTPLTSQLAGVVAPSKMSKLGKAAGVGLAAGFAAAGIGKMLFDVGKEFDEAYDNIRVQTGATGKEMRKLKGAFRDTIGSVPTDFDTASKAVAGLNQRLEVTGKPLRALSKQLTALSEVTGTDITENVEAVTRLFGDWSVKTKDQTDTLDGLFRIAQQTGGSVSELSRLLVQFGAPLRNLGIDLDFAAAMFANFEKSGVNISTVLSGLRLSVGNLAQPTDDLAALLDKLGINAAKPEKALAEVFKQIKALDDQASKSLAIELFGKRAGPDLRDAVVTGRFALQDLMKEFRSGDGTIRGAERRTRDFDEQMQLFANNLKLFVEPIATEVFKRIGQAMKALNKLDLKGVVRSLKEFWQEAGVVRDVIGAVVRFLVDRFEGAFRALKGIVQAISGVLTGDFGRAWEGVKNIFAGAAQTILAPFRAVASVIGGLASRIGRLLSKPFTAAWDLIKNAFRKGADVILGIVTTIIDSWAKMADVGSKMPGPIGDAFDDLQTTFEDASDSVNKFRERLNKTDTSKARQEYKRLASEVSQSTGSIKRDTEKDMGDAEQSAKTHGKGVGRGISQPYQAAAGAARGALGNIEKNTNSALKELKQKPIKFGFQQMAESEAVGGAGRQRGGPIFVGGKGTGDIVPAMLEPGEVVLNRKAVKALGGAGRANRINKRFPRFQGGGMVDPAGPGTGVVNPAIADVVGSWSKQYNAAINYGYDPGGGHVSPGHNVTGTATDTSPAGGWTSSATALFERGLRSLLGSVDQILYGTAGIGTAWPDHGRGNHAHIEWGMHPAVQGAIAQMVKAIQITGPNHVAKNIAQGTTNLVRAGANKFLQSKMGGIGGADIGSFGAEGVLGKSQLMSLWDATGRAGDANLMAAIALAESGGDPRAIGNDPGGTQGLGLWQITTGYNDDIIAQYGGRSAMLRPGPNAQAAHAIFSRQGTSAWAPSQGNWGQFLQRGGVVGLQGGGAVQGHGGESPSTPLFDWFRVMFDQPLVDTMKGIVGKIGVNPNRFENMATSYGEALDFDELGTVAMALDTDDPITGATTYGIANGRTAVGGLGSDLGQGWLDLELGQLLLVRDRILTAIPIVDTLTKFVKGKIDALTKPGKDSYESIAKRLYDDAKKAYDDLQDKIEDLRAQIKKLESIKKPTGEQKQRLSDLKGRLNGLVNALGVAKQIMDDSKFRVGAVGDVAGAFGARVTALDAVKVALKTGGAEDGSWPSLEELQGRTGAAGSIFDTRLEITEALRAAGERALSDAGDTGTTGDTSALQELNAELLRQQLEEQRRLTAIAEAQTPIFEQFYGRTFHSGGIIGGIGNQPVVARAGEGIFTEDQMAAMGGSNVTVVVEDGAVDPNKIRVVVNDELSSVAARATRVGGTKGQKAVYR